MKHYSLLQLTKIVKVPADDTQGERYMLSFGNKAVAVAARGKVSFVYDAATLKDSAGEAFCTVIGRVAPVLEAHVTKLLFTLRKNK